MSERINELKKLIGKEKDSGRVISELMDLLEEMDNEIASLNARCDDFEEELEAVNEDINLINDGMHIEEYDTVFTAVCPYCEKEIEINVEELEDMEEITCPHCKKEVTLEWDDECDCGCEDHDCDDDCDCGCHDED